MENYQTPEGVRVPKVLQPYMMGKEFIPYNKEKVAAWIKKVKEEEEEANAPKGKGGAKGGKDKGAKDQGAKAKEQPKKEEKKKGGDKKANVTIPADAKKLLDECEAVLSKSNYMNGKLPTTLDTDTFVKVKEHQAHLTGGHPHTMSWFGMIYRFSDAMKAKWAKAGGATKAADDDMDLFGDDDEDDAAAAKAAAAAAAAKGKKKKEKPPEMSLIIFEVKPLDDTTSLDDMAKRIFALK